MSHNSEIIGQTVLPKEADGGDMVIVEQYEAPLDADGNPTHDPYKAMDAANRKWMFEVLKAEYPGYFWRTDYRSDQGVALFSIPILMGMTNWWAIVLSKDTLDAGILKRGGGELLERYGCRRGKLYLPEFLEAREKYSALVVPTRKVPG